MLSRIDRGDYQPEIKGDVIHGNIIHVDGFGNVVTNITYETLEKMGITGETNLKVTVEGREYKAPYVRRFSAVNPGELLFLVAGGGYMEISVNQGNAAKHLGLSTGAMITLRKD